MRLWRKNNKNEILFNCGSKMISFAWINANKYKYLASRRHAGPRFLELLSSTPRSSVSLFFPLIFLFFSTTFIAICAETTLPRFFASPLMTLVVVGRLSRLFLVKNIYRPFVDRKPGVACHTRPKQLTFAWFRCSAGGGPPRDNTGVKGVPTFSRRGPQKAEKKNIAPRPWYFVW